MSLLSDNEDWVAQNYEESWKDSFNKDGFLVIQNLLDDNIVKEYLQIYDKLLNSTEALHHRYDLGQHAGEKKTGSENICQIMWPSLYEKKLLSGAVYVRIIQIVKKILGKDMELDFDMMINKFPKSNTATPWHQDESYWPDLPDKRATSCWVALDDATVDNGCMWYVKGSHLEGSLRPYRRVNDLHHARYTDTCSEKDGNPLPLSKGSCTLHHGRTLHYTRGNTTNTQRRAYILNFRPKEMIKMERNIGFDHGKPGKSD